MAGHDYAAEGRARKAMALACVLHRSLDGADPDIVIDLPDIDWQRAATLANVRPPSEHTKHAVVGALKAIAEDEARHPDPFKAFAGGAS